MSQRIPAQGCHILSASARSVRNAANAASCWRIACHKAGKLGASPLGPDLSQIAKIQTPDYIMKKILDPKGMGTVANYPAGVMPQDLGTRLAAKEYVDLVAFLLTLK